MLGWDCLPLPPLPPSTLTPSCSALVVSTSHAHVHLHVHVCVSLGLTQMVNAGAIATGSCIMPTGTMANRLRAFTNLLQGMAGDLGHVGYAASA